MEVICVFFFAVNMAILLSVVSPSTIVLVLDNLLEQPLEITVKVEHSRLDVKLQPPLPNCTNDYVTSMLQKCWCVPLMVHCIMLKVRQPPTVVAPIGSVGDAQDEPGSKPAKKRKTN